MDNELWKEYGRDAKKREMPSESELEGKYFAEKEGLTIELVKEISEIKGEPEWMKKKRVDSFRIFKSKPMPSWGPDLSGLDFDSITSFVKPRGAKKANRWEDVPEEIKKTFERLGIPEAERKFLAGASAQYDSEVLYKRVQERIGKMGVIFTDMDTAVKEHPELVKKYFMDKCVPAHDNKFSALHGAFWSGGSFAYVPEGVKVPMPLQIYFMMSYPGFGQFEHTIIVAEEKAWVQYIEGCTAPYYTKNALHSSVVEIFAGKNSRVRFTSIQNWSKNVYNLNTKRALVGEGAAMEWISGTLGSGTTMLYPCSVLAGRGARAEHLSVTIAGKGQVKDTGAKVIHSAPSTSSNILSKSICSGGGLARYRGLVLAGKNSRGSGSNVRCDSIISGRGSKAETVPTMDIGNGKVQIRHEASVGRISEEQMFYLASRGIAPEEAAAMIVRGFIEPIVKELPLEYAVEMNRLVEMEMEGAVG